MHIGFSFFWQFVLGLPNPNKAEFWHIAIPDIDQALINFKQYGVQSIELKLTEKADVQQISAAIHKLMGNGFYVTFHAPSRFHYPDDLSWQLQTIYHISEFVISTYKFTPMWIIHPLNSTHKNRTVLFQQTLEYLQQILTELQDVPARFALEILRNRENSAKLHLGDNYEEILEILTNVHAENLGICWDFGHAYAMHQRGLQQQFPPVEFLNQVVHCHVHDCLDQKTHLPLGHGEISIQESIQLLKSCGYDGILNLEFVPHRIDDPLNFIKYVKQSVFLISELIQ